MTLREAQQHETGADMACVSVVGLGDLAEDRLAVDRWETDGGQ